MTERKARSLAERLHRNLRTLAVLTLVFLASLAYAPAKDYFSEWRALQEQYNGLAVAQGLAPIAVGLKQVWRPKLGLTDRCATCHVGMGAGKPLAKGGALFGEHPEVHHDVTTMGCTICHEGQGRATTTVAAHGSVPFWDEPMLPREHLEASCGVCHGAAAHVPPSDLHERGRYYFEYHGCSSCHRVDGHGGDVGPDLSGVALKGFDRDWHIRHLKDPSAAVPGSRMMSFGHLPDDQIEALLAYLDTLVGAPVLMQGKAVAMEHGCRGCHVIDGVGGDVGPALAEAVSKPASERDFTHVEGPETNQNWQLQHLRHPAEVAPGSKMPAYLLPEEQERALLTYIESLRRTDLPLEEMPSKTLAIRVNGERDFPSDGASLYRTFCSACHGRNGEGQIVAALRTTVPGILNPGMVSVASREFLRKAIMAGRPGRPMPAWAKGDTGLSKEEIETLVDFISAQVADVPSLAETEAAGEEADPALGAAIFGADCAGCHGSGGVGSIIAPSLVNEELLFVASDAYLHATITQGREGTAMPAHSEYDAHALASLIAWIRSHERETVAVGPGVLLAQADGTAVPLPAVEAPAAAGDEADGDEAQATPFPASLQERASGPALWRRELRSVLRVERLEDYVATGSPSYGKVVFESMCSGCHGASGEGGVGPSIGNEHFLHNASDGFIAGTILLGRGGRPMRPFGEHGIAVLERREIGDLITFLRSLPNRTPDGTLPRRTVRGNGARGAELFASYCVGCHGDEGEGRTAPALNNPGFLDAASDGFLQATIARGRRGTAMRAWALGGFGFAELTLRDINDIVTHIRSWQASAR